ncbi:hypothetical protein B0H21DRAFT_741795 [Amylocystis lapponica]|nr:hypothetical protein B0H21DRAFT_741795 [Amylocystis lapponica]
MQMSPSDVDMDGEDDIQQEADELDADTLGDAHDEEPPEDRDVEVEDEEEQQEENSDPGALSASSPPEQIEVDPVPQPRLRIKLRLPAQASSTSSVVATGLTTPDEIGTSRRAASRDVDIESEDSDDDDARSTRSTSVATTATANRPLTARQAVLANVVDSSHVSLAEAPNPRKKKPLTEIEIALKREETARKRRNLSEKKLEDEKAETINRLLKKQSRSKGKRNALSTADDRPTQPASTSNAADADAEDAGDVTVPISATPTMYRWVSTSRMGPQDGQNGDNGDRRMLLSFAVPAAALSSSAQSADSVEMDVDGSQAKQPQQGRSQSLCDVHGCTQGRKYRLVKDWHKGACGMEHLKMLEATGEIA